MRKYLVLLILCTMLLPAIKVEAEDLVYEIQLENPVFKIVDGQIIKNIEGFVVEQESGNISNALNGQKISDSRSGLSVNIDGGHFEISVITASAGRFDLDLVLSDIVKKIGNTVYVDKNKNGTKDSDEFRVIEPYYAVIPEFELDNKIEFTCGETGYVTISGTVYGSDRQDIGIRYKGEDFIDTTQLSKDGNFGFMLNNKLDLDHGGELELVMELRDSFDSGSDVLKIYEAVITTGVVHHLPLDCTVTHSTIPQGTLSKDLNVIVGELPSWYIDKNDELYSDYTFEAKLYNNKDEEIEEIGNTNLLIKEGRSDNLTYAPFSKTALNKLDIGDYKIVVVLKRIEDDDISVDEDIYKSSFDLSITSSEGDILVGEELFSDQDCGTLAIDLGGEDLKTPFDDLIYYQNSSAVKREKGQKQIIGGYVLKYFAPGQRPKIIHTLVTDDDSKTVYPSDLPAGLSQSQFLGTEKSVVNIPLYQGGEFSYVLDVYEIKSGTYRRIYTKNGSMHLNGFQVNISKNVVYPNEPVEQIITVKDQYGKEVNNAIIYIGKNIYGVNHPEKRRSMAYALNEEGKYAGERGYMFVDTASSNIVDGVYIVEDYELEGSGYLNVVVYRQNNDNTVTRMAVVEKAILIKGLNSWNVLASENSTRPGEEKIYYLNVYDVKGDKIIPDSIDILEDGIGWRTINSIEINANVTSKGIKIVHTCRNETVGDIEFVPHNQYSSNTGSAIVEVIRPELKFKSFEFPIISQDFIKKLEFSVIDPKTGEAIKEDIYYELIDCGSQVEGGLFTSSDGETGKLDRIAGSNSYELYALVKNLNYEEINYAGVKPYLRIFMVSDDDRGDIKLGDIPIEQARLTISPAKVDKTVKDITITYTDAMGYPVKDKLVKVNYRKCGNTDESGKIHHYITTMGNSINVLADTDVKYRFVELEVPIEDEDDTSETETKLVSAPEIVKQPRVTIRINHTEEMLYIRVNNEDQNFLKPVNFYMAKITDLQPGNNKIRVDIYDKKHMSYSETIKVFYEDEFNPITFKIGEKGEYGTPTLINGVTMVPVRFATELGAEMIWDSRTNTVSYNRGNKEIKMTVGSSYAMVNGKITQLQLAPYYNSEGRVMVPLRMVADELGFRVKWRGQFEPIEIKK